MDTSKLVVGQKVNMFSDVVYTNTGMVVKVTSSGVVVSVGEATIPKDTDFIGRKYHHMSFDKDGKETDDSRYDRLGLGPKQSGPGPEFQAWELV